MKPLVSIITTSYNYEKYIKQTIESVLNQTYENWEYIIIDDGSKDNSINIIKEYSNTNKKIKLFTHPNHENKGIIESLKLGINNAKGDYIVFLESDDYLSNNYIQKKIDYLLNNKDIKIITNNLELIGSLEDIIQKSKYLKLVENYWKKHNYPHQINNIITIFNCIPTFSCVMIKTDIIKKCNFNSPKKAWIDWWLWGQVAYESVYCIPEQLTYYRIHSDSYINNDNLKRKYTEAYNFFKDFYKIVTKQKSFKYNIYSRLKQVIRILKYSFLYKINDKNNHSNII